MVTILKKSAFIALMSLWGVVAIYTLIMSLFFSLTGMIPEEPVLMAGYIGVAIVSGGGLVLFVMKNFMKTH